jgi:ribosomal protein S18 acetylase RimI-like enzyme
MSAMNNSFELVTAEDPDQVAVIYTILKLCGEDMLENQGLIHWKNPYPIYQIKQDCAYKEVYLVKTEEDKYVATFMLEFEADDGRMKISKFACLPAFSNQGVGNNCLSYIVNRCRNLGIKTISLDVYSESRLAISFYVNRGFEIVRQALTANFMVCCMEKELSS